MITITLAELRKIADCKERLAMFTEFLGPDWPKDRPITVEQGLRANGMEDVFQILAKMGHSALVARFAVDCAARVSHLMTDTRSTTVLDVTRRFLDGDATREEMTVAVYAAEAAYAASESANAANAAYAAYSASEAALAAAIVAYVASDAAEAAAKAAGDDLAEQAWQHQRLIEITGGTT